MEADRKYPLDIQNVGEDTYIVMSKGHHDFDAFMAAVRVDYDWPLGPPKHMWMRAIPTKQPYMRCLYVHAEPNTRGAFPCTYSWEAYGEDTYEATLAARTPSEKGGR